MTARKRHLVVGRRIACGVVQPLLSTAEPSKVTCGGCQRTLLMADAEIIARRKKNIQPAS